MRPPSIFRHRLLPACFFLATLLGGAQSAAAQAAAVGDEPDEYGFAAISCGAGRVTYEYQTRAGERIVVRGIKYESDALAEEALERQLLPADEVLSRVSHAGEKGNPPKTKVIARIAGKPLRVELQGAWLYSTEAASLESLLKFDAYEERHRRARRSAPPQE